MYIGVNATEEFGGSLNAYIKETISPLALVDRVRYLHQQLAVDAVELNASAMGIRPGVITEETLQGLRDYQERTNLILTMHLPWRSLDVSELVEPARKAAAAYHKELISYFDEHLDISHYVLHVQAKQLEQIQQSEKLDDAAKQRILQKKQDNVRRSLGEICQDMDPRRLCIENLEYGWEEPYGLAAEFDTSICCDVGHLVVQGLDAAQIMKDNLPRIRHIHYHDVMEVEQDGEKTLKDHVALGMGILDIPATLKVVTDNPFDGVFLLEVATTEWAVKSMDVLQSHLNGRK